MRSEAKAAKMNFKHKIEQSFSNHRKWVAFMNTID